MNIVKIDENHLDDLYELYKSAYSPEFWDKWVKRELDNPVFDPECFYQIDMYGIKYDGKIVATAGIADCMFLNTVKTLRFGATHTNYQRRGLMDKLTGYRVDLIRSQGFAGILTSTRLPQIYKKYGFKIVHSDMDDNFSVMYNTLR